MIRTQCIALFHTTSIFTRSITSSGLICARKVCLVEKVVESLKKNPCIATNGNILGTNVKGNTKKYTLHFYLKNCEYNDIIMDLCTFV